MPRAQAPSLRHELIVAIAPVFLGGFLFTALIETYKDDMTSRKDLVLDFYRPMRDQQAECRATEQQLASAYQTEAGTYRLMLNELDHMVAADPATRARGYEVLPQSLLESNSKVLAQIGELAPKLTLCTQVLYRKYEEVALATATYDEFTKIGEQRDAAVQPLYGQRATLLNQLSNQFTSESLMNTLRDSFLMNDDTADGRNAIKAKVHAIGEPAIGFYTQLARNEADILKVEQEVDKKLITLYAKKVNRRYERGVFSALWPW